MEPQLKTIPVVLIVSGVLSLVSLSPMIVFFSLFLMPLGLVLIASPTVFCYTATFAVLRSILPLRSVRARNLVAVAATVTLITALGTALRLGGRYAFDTAATGDVEPSEKIAFAGHVLVKWQALYGRPNEPTECEDLCAALLVTPGVLSVTMMGTTWLLAPSNNVPPKQRAWPRRPSDIIYSVPIKANEPNDSSRRKATIDARWALLRASGETLAIAPPPAAFDLTVDIIQPDLAANKDRLTVQQVEIRGRDGRVVGRRQRVTGAEWSSVGVLVLGSPNWPFPFGAEQRHTGSAIARFNAIGALFDLTTLAPWNVAPDFPDQVRARAAAELTRSGSLGTWPLVFTWVMTLDLRQLGDDDVDLIAKLFADDRLADDLYLPLQYATRMDSRLRGPIVARRLKPEIKRDLANCLDRLILAMPPGTFAVPSRAEIALRADQAARLKVPALVERLADQGKTAIPELIRILQEDAQVEPWAAREGVVAAVRKALTQLGPDAAEALPAVIALYTRPDRPLVSTWLDQITWSLAMARMGLPIGDIPILDALRPGEIQINRVSLAREIEDAATTANLPIMPAR